jgi:hypothetical protein
MAKPSWHTWHTQHLDESSAYCGSDPLLSDPLCLSLCLVRGCASKICAPSAWSRSICPSRSGWGGVYQGYWIYWLRCFSRIPNSSDSWIVGLTHLWVWESNLFAEPKNWNGTGPLEAWKPAIRCWVATRGLSSSKINV